MTDRHIKFKSNFDKQNKYVGVTCRLGRGAALKHKSNDTVWLECEDTGDMMPAVICMTWSGPARCIPWSLLSVEHDPGLRSVDSLCAALSGFYGEKVTSDDTISAIMYCMI